MALGAAAAGLSFGPLAAQTGTTSITIPNAGFEQGEPGALPAGWGGNVAGPQSDGRPSDYRAAIDLERPHSGRASVRLERVGDSAPGAQPFGSLGSRIDAAPLRGRRVRLTAAVRAGTPAPQLVGLWLRVDRLAGRRGFFDNMSDRPIASPDWADYVIEGDVAPDAESIHFGLLLVGAGQAWLDDVRLEDLGPAAPADTASAVSPAEVLDSAIALLREHHVNSGSADWDRLSAEARDRASGATQTQDVYDAIQHVIDRLGERHTMLRPAPSWSRPGSAPRPTIAMPTAELVDGRYGLVRLPAFLGSDEEAEQYETALRDGLTRLDAAGVCGWIIDLRDNGGGNMWPMLSGLDPLLGEAPFGSFRAPSGRLDHWVRTGGEIRSAEAATAERPAFALRSADAPVALLLGPATSSSGEMTAMALIGRPGVRSFGTPTAGFTTGNRPFTLPDGAWLMITTVHVRDRTGHEYRGPIQPDHPTGAGEAPVEARRWLAAQPCPRS